jgi:hypothetical protein
MANKFNDKKIKESTKMIHKITDALMKNLEQYKAAKAEGKDVQKYMKISKKLVDAKKKWQNELDNQIMQMDRGVELAMTEGLSGYDDPKFPKAKYQKVDKAMVDLTKALTKADVGKKAIEALFTNMGVRMAKMYGKN